MPEFFALSREDQAEALLTAGARAARPAELFEKDIWVVWTLRHLFEGDEAGHLVFKGGTSLSKAFHAITRFSEDLDLTYDIRAIAPDLVGETQDALPSSRKKAQTWSDEIRKRLPHVLEDRIAPALRDALKQAGLEATVTRPRDDAVLLVYDSLIKDGREPYIGPEVLLEFGARSTGEPHEAMPIVCDVAELLPDVDFPTTSAQVMAAERTFWEKATAIHVYCLSGRFRNRMRFARHWHDVTRLERAGIAERALADRDLGHSVADHKTWFFREPGPDQNPIDYHAAVDGDLRLMPPEEWLGAVRDDYEQMISSRMLLGDEEDFESLMEKVRQLEARANQP